MSRSLHVLTKKLRKNSKTILSILGFVLIFILLFSWFFYRSGKATATSEEMTTQGELLVSILTKLEPEEIELISDGDQNSLSIYVPNKTYGYVEASIDGEGNSLIRYDYQKGQRIFVSLMDSFILTLIIFAIVVIYNGNKKEKTS